MEVVTCRVAVGDAVAISTDWCSTDEEHPYWRTSSH